MERKPAQRRLAAILAADVVGYSRLMSVDEMGTLTSLKAHRRELIDPAIAGHHGRIVKTTGDGALVALHSDFDWLIIARSEFWQVGGVDGESDGSGDAGLSCDEAGFFER